jgi:23S rRNA (cytosine1962-C5)-methyltransferase
MPSVSINRRGEDRARAGHPWIYRSDVTAADAAGGDLVRVQNERGRPVGHALFSDESEITLRMIAFGAGEPTADFIELRLAVAIAYRESLGLDATA